MREIGPDDFIDWLRQAEPEQLAIYHKGQLTKASPKIKAMGGILLRLSQAFIRSADYYRAKRDSPGSGNLFLFQMRAIDVEGFVYCAKVIRRCTEAEIIKAQKGTQWEIQQKRNRSEMLRRSYSRREKYS
jgi:hypothetical protein